MLLTEKVRNDLLLPLQAVNGIVERRHTLPILANVLIEKKSGRMVFLSTDGDIQIQTFIEDANDINDYSLTVSARKLLDVLKSLPDNKAVTFDLLEKNQLMVRSGKSRFQLQTLPAEDFPRLIYDDNQEQVVINLSQKQLKKQIGLVQYAMAQQDVRYYLNGLLLQTQETSLKTVSTDGHRLAYANTEISEVLKNADVILPRKVVTELYRLLLDTQDNVAIKISPSRVAFEFNNNLIISKLVEGKFPDYERVIPAESVRSILLDKVLFQQMLQRVAILANEKLRGVKFIISEGLLQILSTNSEQEEAREELEIDYQGEKIDIGFNVNYLLDVLSHLADPVIKLSFSNGNNSALITLPESDKFKYVLMPMKI